MKQGIDALRGLRCKLLMMGIPLSGPSYIYGGNMSVVHNIFRHESVFRKKINLVCYHTVQESVAMGKSLVEHLPSKQNVEDLMKKVFMDRKESTWSVKFFMIFMTTISYQ